MSRSIPSSASPLQQSKRLKHCGLGADPPDDQTIAQDEEGSRRAGSPENEILGEPGKIPRFQQATNLLHQVLEVDWLG
jgi:hypothetical protein